MVMTPAALLMVKMPFYQVVRMIAVRNRLVPASRSMFVFPAMAPALVIGCS